MPDLSLRPEILDSVIYLYSTVEAALSGERTGGTGVVLRCSFGANEQYVALTNWHVSVQSRCSVVRYTAQDGRTKVIPSRPEDWFCGPSFPDIAFLALNLPPQLEMHPVAILEDDILKSEEDLYPGEDLFMAGRFVDYDGKLTNRPALRFGALSMTDVEVLQPNTSTLPSHVADMRSKPGFSGSPVYAYRPNGTITVASGSTLMTGMVLDGRNSRRQQGSARNWGGGTNTTLRLVGLNYGGFMEVAKATMQHTPEQAELYMETSSMCLMVRSDDILDALEQFKLKCGR